jgi:hypothetical protein
VFCKYKIKEKDVKISLKINNKGIIGIGFASKVQCKNKNFKWEEDKLLLEWYQGNLNINIKEERLY